jgi:catechol 2,3-dioxygenase-like lactoylglutathione lyase family enzyme
MITGLNHVQLAGPRGCEPRMRDFYARVLGLTEIAKPPSLARRGGAWFAGPGFELHIGIEEPFRPARKAHPAFEVEALDEMAARLSAAGYEVTRDDPLEIPDGRRYLRFFTSDPAGNRLEFLKGLPRERERPSEG